MVEDEEDVPEGDWAGVVGEEWSEWLVVIWVVGGGGFEDELYYFV